METKFIHKKLNLLRTQKSALEKDKPEESISLKVSEIEAALRRNHGNLLQTAQELKVNRDLLKRKVSVSPSLTRLVENLREEFVDVAEAKLREHVEDGYFPAVSLVVRTIGKERGYSEKVINEHEVGAGTAAALIEAMRKGAGPKEIDVDEYEVE